MGEKTFLTALQNSKRFIAEADALENIVVLSNTQEEGVTALSALSGEDHKLYLLGHGIAGSRGLFANEDGTEGALTAKEVVEQLVEGKLDHNFYDFRTLACHSAETREATSFVQTELDKAAKPKHSKNLFKSNKIIEQPLAKYLSDELYSHGFKNTAVTGYHGAGRIYAKEHNLRTVLNSSVPDVRASTVKRVFTKDIK